MAGRTATVSDRIPYPIGSRSWGVPYADVADREPDNRAPRPGRGGGAAHHVGAGVAPTACWLAVSAAFPVKRDIDQVKPPDKHGAVSGPPRSALYVPAPPTGRSTGRRGSNQMGSTASAR